MLKINLGSCNKFFNLMFKEKYKTLKTMSNSTRAILANISRIRNMDIERYFYHNFKQKFNEKKNKYIFNTGRFLLGATVFSFAEDKITDEEIENHFQEFYGNESEVVTENVIDNVSKKKNKETTNYRSRSSSIFSHGRRALSKEIRRDKHTNHQRNDGSKRFCASDSVNFIDSSWTQMIDSKSVKLWRRPMKSNETLFEYRLCGSFDDISAEDFFFVQTDIEYRKSWDDLVVDLRILCTDETTETETIRWVTHYPYPMNDREYIFKRRSVRYGYQNSAIIVSKAVDLSSPSYNNLSSRNVKIDNYKSVMYIQSHNKFDENGVDYFLIYYDDPKTNFPSAAVSWMSTSGIPSFMDKVHKAALHLQVTRSPKPTVQVMERPAPVISKPNDSFYTYFTAALLSTDTNIGKLESDNDIYDAQKSE